VYRKIQTPGDGNVLGRSLLLPPTHSAERAFNSETDCGPGKFDAGG
jgi:hypothetical protein